VGSSIINIAFSVLLVLGCKPVSRIALFTRFSGAMQIDLEDELDLVFDSESKVGTTRPCVD
jgi:hypothetical protein